MFFDVWEAFLDLFDLTIRPSVKNLFSSKKNFIGMFLAFFFLETLLSVICIAGVDSLKKQSEIVADYTAYTAKLTDDEERSELDKSIEVILNGSNILAGALIIWGISALVVFWKMTTAAAERNKFIWGLYITYGSAKKKIRRMLSTELNITLFAGMAAGYPAALMICRAASGGAVRGSAAALFLALLIALLSVRFCVELETALLTSKTCEKLLGDEGSAGNFVSPRRSGPLTLGFTPWRYASTIMFRMRKYYIALALAAAVPVVIWISCSTASISEAAAVTEDIEEYTLISSVGIEGEILKNEYYGELGSIGGVASVSAVAAGEARKLGTHILLDPEQTGSPNSCVTLRAIWADGEATIALADDPTFYLGGGYEFGPIHEGEAALLIPLGDQTYNYADLLDPDSSAVDYIMIAVSKSGGGTKIFTGDMTEYLDGQINRDGEYEYVRLKIVRAAQCYAESASGDTFLDVPHPYFLVSEKDYERIAGISLEDYKSTVPTSKVTVDASAYSDGTVTLTLPRDSISFIPREGNLIGLYFGSYPPESGKADLAAEIEGLFPTYAEGPRVINIEVPIRFQYLRIYEVVEKGEYLAVRVAPLCQPTIFGDFPYSYSLRLGTTEIEGDEYNYVARSYKGYFKITYGEIDLGEKITFLKATAVRAADIGSHILLEAKRIKNTEGRLPLDPVYATNDFTLASADSMTPSSLGLDGIGAGEGKITVVMPETPGAVLSLGVGQKVRLAYRRASAVSVNADLHAVLDPLYQLEQQLKTYYEYAEVVVGEIITAKVDHPYIFVESGLYSELLGLESAYEEIKISIRPDLPPSEYNALTVELRNWADYTSTEDNRLSLRTSGKYIGILLRSAADYSVWLKIIAFMTPLLIPLVWYYPQSMIFARRREDYETLFHLGRKKKEVRKIFAAEALFAAVLSAAAVVLLCPAGLFIFDFAVTVFELPLEFRYSDFDALSMLLGCLATAASAFLTVWFGYLAVTAGKSSRKKGQGKQNADS